MNNNNYVIASVSLPGDDNSPVAIIGNYDQVVELSRNAAEQLAVDILHDSDRYSVKDNATEEWL